MVTVSPSTLTSSAPISARSTPASTSPVAMRSTSSPEKRRSRTSPPLCLVTGTDSVQRTVASWSSSRTPSTTTGPVVVRAGLSSRSPPRTGTACTKSKRLIPTPSATLTSTITSASTSVVPNPPPLLPTSSLSERAEALILHGRGTASRTLAGSPSCKSRRTPSGSGRSAGRRPRRSRLLRSSGSSRGAARGRGRTAWTRRSSPL